MKRLIKKYLNAGAINAEQRVRQQLRDMMTNKTDAIPTKQVHLLPPQNNTRQYNVKKVPLIQVGWNILRPFMNISTYRLNLNEPVSLTKEDLWKQDEGNSLNLLRSTLLGYETRLGNNLGGRHNNPCNISPSKGDFGYVNSSYAADGQNHAGYDNIVNGLASTMRLFTNNYNNKSVRSMNNGLQGYLNECRKRYTELDWKALENARLVWITHVSDSLGISPFTRLNLNDKETMFNLIAAVAKLETGSVFSRNDLEAAWKLFKGGR